MSNNSNNNNNNVHHNRPNDKSSLSTLTSSSSSSSFGSIGSSDDKMTITTSNGFGGSCNGANQLISLLSITRFINAAIQNDVNMINTYYQTLNIPVDVVDKNGYTALIYASRNGNVNVVRRLIELNANVDYQEPSTLSTALHYAAQCGHTRTAEVLIKFGQANKEIQNQAGKTPYDLAKDFGHGNNKIMKSLFQPELADGNHLTSPQFSLSSPSSSSLIKTRKMGSSSSIDSGLSHDHMMNRNEFDLNNNNSNNDFISSYKSESMASFGKKKFVSKKNISYLPHTTLLERFAQYGCYRLMGDGYGFAILAKNGPPKLMAYETFINLSIPMNNVDQLLIALNKIVLDLESNIKLTMKEYEDFDPIHPDNQRINNLFAYNLWRKENIDKIMKIVQFIQQWKHMESY
ncbi:Target of rapamycin complex 2 subunit avo2 [Dermatophagoides farinae]|uniref:Ankyrin repeat domain containing protein 1 n=1 Tax=Dermatophagoides farinae TaxID=6954 RepID=A0A922LBL8_DERFA|nr:uncharacterized protein DDB_G0283357-like [Dermatophagoides farinae]KAH7642441.1 ankyrin repeat domain containing protein 1 [Dermatophagoides farinae]KAH9529704.1 Target of rapamycin complex 2 subunit avo2 [Dermatophagoides farinae]